MSEYVKPILSSIDISVHFTKHECFVLLVNMCFKNVRNQCLCYLIEKSDNFWSLTCSTLDRLWLGTIHCGRADLNLTADQRMFVLTSMV